MIWVPPSPSRAKWLSGTLHTILTLRSSSFTYCTDFVYSSGAVYVCNSWTKLLFYSFFKIHYFLLYFSSFLPACSSFAPEPEFLNVWSPGIDSKESIVIVVPAGQIKSSNYRISDSQKNNRLPSSAKQTGQQSQRSVSYSTTHKDYVQTTYSRQGKTFSGSRRKDMSYIGTLLSLLFV